MGIEATSTTVSSSAPVQTSSAPSQAQKSNSSDSSFKDEMSKVSKSEDKKETNVSNKKSETSGDKKTDSKSDNKLSASKNDGKELQTVKNKDGISNSDILLNGQFSIDNANMMLSNNIAQMIENTVSVNDASLKNWTFSFGNDVKSSIKMNESDADFFINLTQNENVNVQSITAQAQNMVNHGADVAEVKQNVQVSQALLNALSEARENNQPLRIDFDKNISVILRVGKDGAVSAQFIPGDKAVEQYLRNNIDALRSSFDEQELPYSELSYSNASKEQNKRRREEKRQGE